MDTITQLVIKIVLFLIILFIVGYLLKRFAGMNKNSFNNSTYIESLDRYIITSDKWLEIIKVGEKILLLGITPQGINEIRELSQEDLHELSKEYKDNLFAKVLEKYTKK